MKQYLKSLSISLCMCAAALLATSQPSMAANHKASGDTLTFTIAPYSIKDTGLDVLTVNDGQRLYAPIKGFNFEAGYHYTIVVKKRKPCRRSGRNINDCRYTLKRIISKKQAGTKATRTLEIMSANPAQLKLVETGSQRVDRHFYAHLKQQPQETLERGEHVQVTGYYYPEKHSRIVHIFGIEAFKRLSNANTAKAQCEAQEGGVWRAVGRAQTLRCIINYADGGKPCTASSQCQGSCLAQSEKKGLFGRRKGVCAKDNNPFGCRPYTIEQAKAGAKGTICTD